MCKQEAASVAHQIQRVIMRFVQSVQLQLSSRCRLLDLYEPRYEQHFLAK